MRQLRVWQLWSSQNVEFSILRAAHCRTGHVASADVRPQVQSRARVSGRVLTVGAVSEILVCLGRQVSCTAAAGRLALDVYGTLVTLSIWRAELVSSARTYGLCSRETLPRLCSGSPSICIGLGTCQVNVTRADSQLELTVFAAVPLLLAQVGATIGLTGVYSPLTGAASMKQTRWLTSRAEGDPR